MKGVGFEGLEIKVWGFGLERLWAWLILDT